MKEITINRNSWHYYIATKVAQYSPYYDNMDICTYRKHVMGGLFLIAVALAIVTALAFGLVQLTFGIVFSLIYGAWLFSEAGEIALLLCIVIGSITGLFAGIAKATSMYNEYKENKAPAPDGFVKEAYKSWKEKYCVPVTFVGGQDHEQD